MTVEILISGLAICYQIKNEDLWQVVFLCDSQHPVNFSDTAGHRDRPLFVGQDGFVSFIAKSTVATRLEMGRDFDRIFNLASPGYGHGPDCLKAIRSGSRRVFTMVIPSAILSTKELTASGYVVKDTGTSGNEKPIGQVAKVLEARIELEDDGDGLTLMINNGTGKSEIINYTDDVCLTFDNDCHLLKKLDDDFLHYYEWLEDEIHLGKKFTAGKESLLRVGSFDSDQGNCDPIVVNPPPH